ncbi:MAG: hypothetical protein QOG43_2033, partial [Actinomycetota bacterium]|nr:hypothetical protein [Actinomycetota bacterium]
MVETRDTSKDGSKNKLEFVVLTRLAPVWWLIQRSRWLTKKVN